jgi:predicted dehydrogenase
MPSDRVKIGFAGVGSMGQCAHLRNYYARDDCEVVAVAELREKTARAVARRYRVEKVYADAAEMLEKEELDGVVASQPFNRHGVLLPELLEFKKPIFIEKPLSSTPQSGEAILTALEKSGAWIMVGYNKRSDPASVWARRRVQELKASGELGRLTYLRATMPPGDWIAGGFAERIDEGDPRPELGVEPPPDDMDEATHKRYTAFVNYYIHQVNLTRFLLGENYEVTHADPAGVLLVGRSASGVPVTLEMAPYRTTIDWQETHLVCFEKGYVKLELPAPLAANRPGSVEAFSDPGGRPPETLVPRLPWTGSMAAQAGNFVAALRGDRPPPCEAREAYQDLRVARAYIKLLTGD